MPACKTDVKPNMMFSILSFLKAKPCKDNPITTASFDSLFKKCVVNY